MVVHAQRALHPFEAEWDADLIGDDPLGFPGYRQQLVRAGGRETVRTGVAVAKGPLGSARYVAIEGCFEVLGGTMGAGHGERVARAYQRAVDARLPVVVLSSSGGARMQEGMISLIQMARAAAGASSHARAGLLSLAIYRPPTTGGVFASYASLVDVKAAQPGATVGFAGPRLVEHTLGTRLGQGSHTAESAFAAGIVDALVPEADQPAWVEAVLGVRPWPFPLDAQRRERLERVAPPLLQVAPADSSHAWAQVLRARAPGRPTGVDWASVLCSSWVELRGRDPTLRAGLATLAIPESMDGGSNHGRREGDRQLPDSRPPGLGVVLLASDRYAGSGRPSPRAYQLAQRAIALAGRLGLPLISLVDTRGANPAPDSEAEGIAGAIARTLLAMAELPSTSVSVCVGEGGSGGALALAAADRLLMQEHAVFSVMAPGGAAVILGRGARLAPLLAERLRLTSADLLELGVIDGVVAEVDEPAHNRSGAGALRSAIFDALATAVPGDRLRRFDEATARWLRSATEG